MSKNQELNHPQPSRRTNQNSYAADEDTFVKEDVAITSTGVAMLGKPKLFTVVPQELEAGTPIGRGASSYVLKSKHVPTGTCLALKVMNMYDKGKREQLIREIRTLYDAQCPCLVKFFGAFYRDSTITIALEYMDGGALENVIEQVESIPEPILANITYQILYGLSYLHRHNHVHRDIKPSNILINSQGQVKVTDFGIAAEVCNTTPLCTSYVGTFKYMSPERIRRHAYGYSSDIWSLGLVILECATGRYPYEEYMKKNTFEMILAVMESAPPGPSVEYFTPEFCTFISNCLQVAPSDRLSADILLGSPWLHRHGATSLENAQRNVYDWILSFNAST